MRTIKPTVGRVVWFFKYRVDTQTHEGPFAAHIAYVHNDAHVNLMVIDSSGSSSSKPGVELVQADAVPPSHDYCTWMPYQVSQANAVAEAAKRGFSS